jgi:crotonobetainyl-CoA:carnitine CoA-transferase CaiB-like acyl-CoA transferase
MDGMTVLDLTSNVAGPLACQVMADLGARVIKIEPAEGEAARRIVALRDGAPLQPYFAPHNRGKLSVQIDLRTPEGLADALRLVDESDVYVDGFRPGVSEKLGLGVAALRARNPRLVYVSLSAYGGEPGPGQRPGIDMLVQAETGLTTGLRRPDGAPSMVMSQIVDACSGHVVAQAVLAALLGRERTGAGEHVSVAMYDVACSMQANHLTTRLNSTGDGGGRVGTAGVAVAPSGVFRAGDGFLVLAAYVPKHWALLCQALDRPDLATDPRFVDQRTRTEHLAELTAELESIFATASADAWAARLQAAGLMAAKAASWTDVISSEVYAGRRLTVEAELAGNPVRTIRTPARFGSFDPPGDPHLPGLGEHNEQLLGHA